MWRARGRSQQERDSADKNRLRRERSPEVEPMTAPPRGIRAPLRSLSPVRVGRRSRSARRFLRPGRGHKLQSLEPALEDVNLPRRESSQGAPRTSMPHFPFARGAPRRSFN